MRIKIAMLMLLAGLAVSTRLVYVAHAKPGPRDAADEYTVACRVLEAHAAAWPGVTIVLFHQQEKQDQALLGSLLNANSGARVGVKMGAGDWKPATVVRLKSCFGRGLLMFPAGAEAPKDGETLLVKFPSEKESE